MKKAKQKIKKSVFENCGECLKTVKIGEVGLREYSKFWESRGQFKFTCADCAQQPKDRF